MFVLVAGEEGFSKHPCGMWDRSAGVETRTLSSLYEKYDCMAVSYIQLPFLHDK